MDYSVRHGQGIKKTCVEAASAGDRQENQAPILNGNDVLVDVNDVAVF